MSVMVAPLAQKLETRVGSRTPGHLSLAGVVLCLTHKRAEKPSPPYGRRRIGYWSATSAHYSVLVVRVKKETRADLI